MKPTRLGGALVGSGLQADHALAGLVHLLDLHVGDLTGGAHGHTGLKKIKLPQIALYKAQK